MAHTLIQPAQIAQAGASAGNVLAWNGTIWEPDTAGAGTVTGTGTTGRITQWNSGAGGVLEDSTLIKSGAGVLTLSAAATDTLIISGSGTLNFTDVLLSLIVDSTIHLDGNANTLTLSSSLTVSGTSGGIQFNGSGNTLYIPSGGGTAALGAGTLTAATSNDVTVASHTHAITATATGTASTLMKTNASGGVGLMAASTINANSGSLPSALTGTLLQIANADSTATRLLLDAGASNGAITFRRANTSIGSPSALAADDAIGSITAFGYGATGYTSTSRAYMNLVASQTWTDSNQGTYIQFGVTPNNSTTVGVILQLGASNTAQTIGFYGVTPAVKQTSGANLTNNVTSGGSTDTITDWTNLTTYSTDAAAIRNAVYQLARKLKQINDGLRTYGLFT